MLGSNAFSGTTTISAGTLQLGNGGATGILAGGGPIEIDGALVLNRSDSVTMNNPLTGEGALLKTSGGTVTLTGDLSSYGGPVTVAQGQLVLTTLAAASGYTINSGATLQFNGATVALGSAYSNAEVTVNALAGGLVQYQNTQVVGGYLSGMGRTSSPPRIRSTR